MGRCERVVMCVLVMAGPAGAHLGLDHLVACGLPDHAGGFEDPMVAVATLIGAGAQEVRMIEERRREVEAYRQEIFARVDSSRAGREWNAQATEEVRCGIGNRIITPPRGCPLAGYGDRLKTVPFLYLPRADPFYYSKLYRPSRGTADDLRAKALVIDNGAARICIVGVDAIGVTQLIFEDVLSRIRHLGLDRDSVLLSATHTHGGSGDAADRVLWWFGTADLWDRRIYEPLVNNVVGAIEDAVADLRPGRLGVGWSADAGEGLSHNRRDGDTLVDPEVGLLRVDDLEGRPRAVAWNFAAHGTIVGGENRLFTGDGPGYAERELEARLGPGAVAIFLNGAEGDVSPSTSGGQGEWERAAEWGVAMADVVEAVRAATLTSVWVDLAGAHRFLDLPDPYMRPGFFLDPPTAGRLVVPLKGLVEEDGTNFTGIRVGDAAFVSMPGEAIAAIGLEVKAHGDALGLDGTFVVGLANGHLGYMTTEEEYWQGGYEAGATFFGPSTGDLMIESAESILDALAEEGRNAECQ